MTANPYISNEWISDDESLSKTKWKHKAARWSTIILNSFKSQDGTVDINKMVNTAGQMMNAVTQVSSLVKGFGGMFKV